MALQDFDVIIMGAGPGGYVAAIRAAQLGKKVAVIEANHVGGICLNWGCIPTKALLRTSEIYHLMHRLDEFGLKADNISFDLHKVIARSRGVAAQLSKGVQHLLKKNKITVFDGYGMLKTKSNDTWQVIVEKNDKIVHELQAPHIVLATGARARTLPNVEPSADIWTYREAMVPSELPKRLLVIGSGAIGIEFASFYRAMGSEVAVIEMLDRILPVEDEEISTLAQKAFSKLGMNIMTKTTLKHIEKTAEGMRVTVTSAKGEQHLIVDKVISAIGIVGNTENLGLENTRVRVEKSHVIVNEWCETDEPGIYAIGDLAGAPWLAHKASHEGVQLMNHLFDKTHTHHPMKRENIPGCTYSHPQIASVGLTEKQARDQGHTLKVGRFPFMANGKAIALGESEGLIKTIFDAKTGELLGAHMIGAEVTELIQGYVVAKTNELTEAELMHTVFPHPTLSEMMHESVLNAHDQTLHY